MAIESIDTPACSGSTRLQTLLVEALWLGRQTPFTPGAVQLSHEEARVA